MSSSRPHKLGGYLALFAGVGCATAIVDQDPEEGGAVDGNAATSATGGTTVASNGGAAPSLGGTTSSGGASGTSAVGTTGMPSAGGNGNTNAGGRGGSGTPAAAGRSGGVMANCSNIAGRSVTINGMRSMCGGSLPDKLDGGYYFEFGAAMDSTNYTSFYWYTS
jgi:hypothetical protein